MSHSQTAARTVSVPQNAETEVTFVAAPGVNLRYAYFRSGDSVANQIEGQDYLAFRYDSRRLVFVVCDGVGSSFCGNIAARVLGETMLDWLWSLDTDRLTSAAALSETARSYLLKAQPEAGREVARYAIPDHLPPLVQQALEAQRAYGSETVFAAGRIDHSADELAAGRLLLVWMGDTQVHLYDDAGREIDIKAVFNANDRWSSTQGVRGSVHSWLGDAGDIARLVAFSDGISSHADRLTTYSDLELEEASQAQYRTANSDDVALLDIVRHTPTYLGLTGTERPVDAALDTPQVALIHKEKRASTYEVTWTWEANNKAKFELQEATNPAFRDAYSEEVGSATAWRTEEPRPPGRYYYRVRAIVGRKGMAGPWSAPQTARVAYPPPDIPQIQPVGPTPVQGAYTLAWDEVENAQDYVLEEATREDLSDATPVYRGRGTDWHAGGGREPGRYYYRVQAVNDGGASAWSAPQVVAVVVPPPPVPTLAFLREVLPGSPIMLSWSDVAQAARYEVQETVETSGDQRRYETGEAHLTLDARPAGRYTFRVRACHEHGCSEWSAPQTAEVLPDAPDIAPELIAEGPDADGQIFLQWTGVERAARYVLEESDQPGFKRTLPMNMGERTQHTLLRREPGFYYYRVRAENISGYSPWSEPVEAIVRPGVPAWIEANLPEEDRPRVEVAWDPVAGQVTYELELLLNAPDADPAEGQWSGAKAVYQGREPASAVRIPKDVRHFAFRVRAVHESGDGGWQYGERVSHPGPPPSTVFEDPVFQPDGEIVVRWQPAAEATHYEIDHARDPSFADAKVYTTDRIRFRYKPQGGDVTWFRVRACNQHGCSQPSDPFQIAIERLHAPRLLPVESPSPGDPVKIAWTEVQGAAHYEIQEADDGSFQNIERHMVNASTLDWTLSTLVPRRVYVRVSAVGPDGRSSEWSETVAVDLGETGL